MEQNPTVSPEEINEFFSSLDKIEEDVTSIWVRQIETGRSHCEGAVIELVNRFEAIVRNLETAMAASNTHGTEAKGQKGERNVRTVLQNGEGKLHAVVAHLAKSMENRDLLVAEVKKLSAYIRDLESMAEAVSSLAFQTNMLALNAAIEAAHAGDRGRGFAVVATQVRQLSSESSDTGRRIRETIKIISGAINGTTDTARVFADEDSARVEAAKQDIGSVLNDFRQLAGHLESSAETLRESTIGIKNDIADALVHLQFQDRVSQILCHVRDNIEKMPSYIKQRLEEYEATGHLSAIDWTELMNELMNTYATQEEFVNHDEKHVASSSNSKSSASLTFF